MDHILVHEYAKKILEDNNDIDKFKMYTILEEGILEVGLKKNKLINYLKTILPNKTLETLAKSSKSKELFLKFFLDLSDEEKKEKVDKLIDIVSKLDEKNGEIVVNIDDIKNEYKTKFFKTKNADVLLKSWDKLYEFDDDFWDFSAFNYDYNIQVKVNPVRQNPITKEMLWHKKIAEEFTNRLERMKLLFDLKNTNHETRQYTGHNITGSNYETTYNIETFTLENDSLIYKSSCICYVSSRNGAYGIYAVFVIQSCKKENYEKYKNMMDENLENFYYYSGTFEDVFENEAKKLSEARKKHIDNMEKLEITTNNSITDKITVAIGNHEASVIEPKEVIKIYNYIDFVYEDIEGNNVNFKDPKVQKIYIKCFDMLMNKTDEILDGLFKESMKLLPYWSEKFEDEKKTDLDYIKKTFRWVISVIIDCGSVHIYCSIYEKETDEDILGDHSLTTDFSIDEDHPLIWSL